MKRKLILGSGLFLLLFACSQENQSNENLVASNVDTTAVVNKISDEAVEDIIGSIPSPLEISMIIKESGGDYDEKLLNSNDNISKYNSSFKKAINLGIYGADLGYVNIYNKSTDALAYLYSIKKLTEELNIGQFYDFNTIKRLATNSENIDSLLYITTSNFQKINSFLHEKKRSDQSVLILTGGWLEGLHITCEIAKRNDNATLQEKIGEQKVVLDQLLLLVSYFKDDAGMTMMFEELKELQKVYSQIQITYTYQESTMEEKDGVLVIVDKSESKVNITKEQINKISDIVERLRNKLTI
jgi:hypothetical protein